MAVVGREELGGTGGGGGVSRGHRKHSHAAMGGWILTLFGSRGGFLSCGISAKEYMMMTEGEHTCSDDACECGAGARVGCCIMRLVVLAALVFC